MRCPLGPLHPFRFGGLGVSAGGKRTLAPAGPFIVSQPRSPHERPGVAAFQQHKLADGATKEDKGVCQHLVVVAEVQDES